MNATCSAIHDEPIINKMSEAQIRQWFQFLYGLGINFHPDDRGEDIVKYGKRGEAYTEAGDKLFSPDGAKSYDAIMDDAFASLGDRVYDIAVEVSSGL